jgi:hypothetical protein
VLFPELCAALLQRRDDFAGPDFSAGDAAIWKAGNEGQPLGNSSTWIKHATSHHLTHIVRRLQRT